MLTDAVSEQMRLLLAGQAPATQAVQVVDGNVTLRFDRFEVVPTLTNPYGEGPEVAVTIRLYWGDTVVIEQRVDYLGNPIRLSGFAGAMTLAAGAA